MKKWFKSFDTLISMEEDVGCVFTFGAIVAGEGKNRDAGGGYAGQPRFSDSFFTTSLEYTVNAGTLRTVMLKIPRRYGYLFLPVGTGLSIYEFVKTWRLRLFHKPGGY